MIYIHGAENDKIEIMLLLLYVKLNKYLFNEVALVSASKIVVLPVVIIYQSLYSLYSKLFSHSKFVPDSNISI